MNLQKAIEILEDLDTTLPQSNPEERRQAVKLGIEALKRIEERRRFAIPPKADWLPGETEE